MSYYDDGERRPRRPAGRPPSADPRVLRVEVYVSEREHAELRRATDGALGPWARDVLLREARQRRGAP